MRRVRLALVLGSLALTFGCSISRAKDEPLPAKAEPSRTIVIASDVNHATVHQFVKGHGRAATREELLEIHRIWIDEEILFREGSKLPGDTSDRGKVVTRALRHLDEKLNAAPPSEAELRRWFDAHKGQYEQPVRFDFEDAPLSAPSTEGAAQALATTLNASTPPGAPANVRSFQKRPESNLVQSYGPEVASALGKAEAGRWLAVRARDGWHVMRPLAVLPATHAVFEAQRAAVEKELTAAALVERRAAAVHALWSRYEIELEEPLDCLADQ
jgi:hypothetical protein